MNRKEIDSVGDVARCRGRVHNRCGNAHFMINEHCQKTDGRNSVMEEFRSQSGIDGGPLTHEGQVN